MRVLIIDGQGGKLGRQLCESIAQRFENAQIVAVGTNTTATAAMMKGGAKLCATGENAVVVNCRNADVIVGPIGIVIADSMLGEITPAMALAVAQSGAAKILIPANRCNNFVAGIAGVSVNEMLDDALKLLESIASEA